MMFAVLRDITMRMKRAVAAFDSATPAGPPPPGRSFTILLEHDDLDGYWVAEVPDLPGCMSQGKTQREAVENVIQAIGEILTLQMEKQALEMGEEVKDDRPCGDATPHRRLAVSV